MTTRPQTPRSSALAEPVLPQPTQAQNNFTTDYTDSIRIKSSCQGRSKPRSDRSGCLVRVNPRHPRLKFRGLGAAQGSRRPPASLASFPSLRIASSRRIFPRK